MKITVIGGGNVGTIIAAENANKGHDVTLYTSKPEKWQRVLKVYNADDSLFVEGTIKKATNSMEEAMDGAELIWVVMPAQVLQDLAQKMLPYAKTGQMIGIAPGSGGAEFAFHDFLAKGCILFGLQRVHTIARLKEYGKSSYMLGRKPNLQLAAIPDTKTASMCKIVSEMFDMPCQKLDNYLEVTLTPSNPILHTTRLYSLFHDYEKGKKYPKNYLFYEEWDDASSEMLIACDKELQELCDTIPLELSGVKSLREYYESPSVIAMTHKIKNIEAFKGLLSPMKQVEDGWMLDTESRYFKADFPFGLKVIKDIAKEFEVMTPNIDRVWEWYYENVMPEKQKFFELTLNKEQFLKLYSMRG